MRDLGHLLFLFVEHLVDLTTSDGLAHRGLGTLANEFLGLGAGIVVKQPGFRIDDSVLHRVLHINNALVTSQDQRLFEHLVLNVTPVTDFELAQLLHVDQLVRLDWRRQAPGETCTAIEFTELTKAHHNCGLTLLDDVKPAAEPQHNRQTQ